MSASVSPEELNDGVPEIWAQRAYVDASRYREMYAFSAPITAEEVV